MDTPLNKNLELISSQNQIKSKKDQMIANLKLEMIQDLKLDDKLIKRNALVGKLADKFINGQQGDPDLTEFFGKKNIKIDEKKYQHLTERYKEIMKIKRADPERKIKKMEWCKELAEELILDQNKMIEFLSTDDFGGKTAEQEAKSSFERLDKNEKYGKKIELIKRADGDEMYFVIKWTQAQLEEIERAERAYDKLYGDEAQEPTQPQPIVQPTGSPHEVPTIQPVLEIAEVQDEETKKKLIALGAQLKNLRIGETIDLTMPDNKIIRLQKRDDKGWKCGTNQVTEFEQYIDKNHEVVEDGNKSHISYVDNEDLRRFLQIPDGTIEPPPTIEEPDGETEGGELEQVELTATISDTTQITRAIAERQAGEKLRKIYKNTARYKPRSRPTKLGMFLGRGYMKDHYTRKYLNMRRGMQRDDNLVKGADRHEMEEANDFNEDIQNVGNIDEANYPRTYAALDTLTRQLTGDANTMPPRQRGIGDTLFQQQFTAIIRRNLDTARPATATDPNRKPLARIIRDNDIQQMSSNITEKLNGFRDHQELADNLVTHIMQHSNEPAASFNTYSRPLIINYFKKYKKNPEFLKTLGIKFDEPTAMEKLRMLASQRDALAHNCTLARIAEQTMKLKVQILTKGEEAYDVKQDLEGFRGGLTKIGNRLDKPISDTSRLGKSMERHPFLKNAFGMLRGGLKLGAMITPALLLSPLGPLAVASGAGGMAFIKTFFKKFAHYNKEHIGYQRNQAVNILQNTQERERLMNEISNMNPAKRFFLYYFGLGRTARDVRQFRDYVMTTHDQLENSDTLATSMEGLLNRPELTPAQQQQLEDQISKGLARLDYHKETGQNFLGSRDRDVAEKEYQKIYRLVLTGSMRLNQDLDAIRQNNYYDNEMDLIHNGTGDEVDQIGYEKSWKRFKHRQTEKALLGAVKAGGVAFGLSYLLTSMASTKESTTTLSDKIPVKENFVLGGHESSASNGVYDPAKRFFDASNTAGKNVLFPYGGGTDLVKVIPGHLTPAEYAAKVADVTKEINAMAINSTTKTNLLSELTKQPWLGVTGQTNAALHNMRCVELIEQGAKALNDSTNAANIVIAPHYAPSVFDVTSATYNNAAERVVQGTLGYSQEITTAAHIIPIPFPGFMNTFKEPDKYGEERTRTQDNGGRRTRTPAPDTRRQNNDTGPARRRSGERVDEIQFTNAND